MHRKHIQDLLVVVDRESEPTATINRKMVWKDCKNIIVEILALINLEESMYSAFRKIHGVSL